ncbi:MAG: molybdopterin-synthase adenylyltransferase MoeB [Candidatus Obscuribacterales bacterium]|nr:molybdopterin-synthase adenylyltransferase MoeB [Candidatus Obscuribacterales bacterium]
MSSALSNSELLRYSRQLLLPEVSLAGQAKLKNASVLLIGAGGLGSPALLYLAAAGIGRIGIAEFDRVDRSNLQRQILYSDSDVGAPKIERALTRLRALNPEIELSPHELRVQADNVIDLISAYDLIIDGSDNFATRYLINDACVLSKKTLVHGAIYRFEGQVTVLGFKGGPCYRCLFPEAPSADAVPNCAEAGVLGVIAGIIGSVQASEALKVILEIGQILSGKLLLCDALSMRFDTLSFSKNVDCAVCGSNPKIKTLEDLIVSCKSEEKTANMKIIAPRELDAELKSGRNLLLLDVRNHEEVALCRLPQSTHIPLPELPARFKELDPSAEIVVYCKSGGRSMRAMQFLESQGFQKTRNLTGGILGWAHEVDPSLPTY